MADATPGRVLRDLQQAQSRLRKAREAIRRAREHGGESAHTLKSAWHDLCQTYRLLSDIPWTAVDDAVMVRQLALARYASALLVRLRRLQRGGGAQAGNELDDSDIDEE